MQVYDNILVKIRGKYCSNFIHMAVQLMMQIRR